VTTRRIIKAVCLAGTLAAVLAAAPAHACLILVGGPQPAGTIAVQVDFLAGDEGARPERDSAARVRRLRESAVPGAIPIPRLSRRSPCSRHFGYAPAPAAVDLVRGQTGSGPPLQGAGSLVEFVSWRLEEEFRLTIGDLFLEERRRRPSGW
jgi:hypothetical protein